MELRHLRYFVAAAEDGSLTLAAEKRLHTAQPSSAGKSAISNTTSASSCPRGADGELAQ